MGHGLVNLYTLTITSGATLSTEVDLGRNFEKVYLMVPSMTSNSQMWLKCAEKASSAGGTYRRIVHPIVNTSTVAAPNDFVIASALTNRCLPIPNGFRYYKVETSATMDGAQAFTIVTADGG